MSEKGTCFVIAPIGEPDSSVRDRSDKILNYIIAPLVQELGYEPLRADNISQPGLITSQVIQHVIDDPLVIADLTGLNPNVFYELAIRHVIRKPVIQIIQAGEPIPFDVANIRTIPVDHTNLESVDEAKREITEQIETLEKGGEEIDNPISVALDLQILRRSENPQEKLLADVLSGISDIRLAISSLWSLYSTLSHAVLGTQPTPEARSGVRTTTHTTTYVTSPLSELLSTQAAPAQDAIEAAIQDYLRAADTYPGVTRAMAEAIARTAGQIVESVAQIQRSLTDKPPDSDDSKDEEI